jgi:hypothetical protein
MTNPTSNFGWQMPTPTDLVTDLPADFEVFGQAVDTSMADLKGGTTGQILSKATNTDMDFTWITNDVGDITAVNVTAPITGGGTSGAVTIGVSAASTSASGVVQLSDSTSTTSSVLASTPTATKSAYDLAAAAVPKSTVTTAGDVIYATGSAAVTRLGIGTAGQVLTVNGGGTAPSWATAPSGSMTSIASGSLSTGSLVLGSISGSYKDLRLVLRNFYQSSASTFKITVNSVTSYDWIQILTGATSGTTIQYETSLGAANVNTSYNSPATTSTDSMFVCDFPDYTNTTANKLINVNFAYKKNSGGGRELVNTYGVANTTSAITTITLTLSAGTFSGGTYILYGVN